MIGLNGSLVTVLLLSYFLLVVCALSYGQPPAGRAAETSGRCTRSPAPDAATIVAFTRSARAHQARSRHTDQTIGTIVLGLREGRRAG